MIKEDYVSFETAKLLKEKGFHCRVKNYYSLSKESVKAHHEKKYGAKKDWNSFELAISRPSQSLVMKWLREEHNIAIVVTPSMFWGKYNVSIYKRGDDYPIGFDGDSLCPSYEQACEVAIKYCLENLI